MPKLQQYLNVGRNPALKFQHFSTLTFYKMRGDFYFKYQKYQDAKDSYSKALQLESYSNALVFRASCYLNLKQYDSCLNDLKLFPETNKEGPIGILEIIMKPERTWIQQYTSLN